jgi:WD40 repeat protein
LTVGKDGSLRLWQIFDEQGVPICFLGQGRAELPHCVDQNQTLRSHTGELTFARWLADGSILTTARDGTARRWDMANHTVRTLPREPYEENASPMSLNKVLVQMG